jgi:hypothetical protein
MIKKQPFSWILQIVDLSNILQSLSPNFFRAGEAIYPFIKLGTTVQNDNDLIFVHRHSVTFFNPINSIT